MLSLRTPNPMSKKLNLRSRFRHITGIRQCNGRISEMIDGEDVHGVRVILWRPYVNPMRDEWSGEVGQGKSGYGFGLLRVRLCSDVWADVTCM